MAVATKTPIAATAPSVKEFDEIQDRAFGLAAATLIGGGFGIAFFGFLTLLSEVVTSTQPALTLMSSVGPLSGKAVYGVTGWLVGYAILAVALWGRNVSEKATYWITGVLTAVGFVFTFPLFWKLFE